MGLQFLADHCVPNSVIQTLRDSNHDVLRLRDILPVESPDAIVIAKALDLGKILLTLNGDFADIVTYRPSKYKRIVALQVHNHPEIIPRLLARLNALLESPALHGGLPREAIRRRG
jgi:predicted nuclease of predicted toxin-antitoxin system